MGQHWSELMTEGPEYEQTPQNAARASPAAASVTSNPNGPSLCHFIADAPWTRCGESGCRPDAIPSDGGTMPARPHAGQRGEGRKPDRLGKVCRHGGHPRHRGHNRYDRQGRARTGWGYSFRPWPLPLGPKESAKSWV